MAARSELPKGNVRAGWLGLSNANSQKLRTGGSLRSTPATRVFYPDEAVVCSRDARNIQIVAANLPDVQDDNEDNLVTQSVFNVARPADTMFASFR